MGEEFRCISALKVPLRDAALKSSPLYRFGQRIVVDLQAQFSKSDGQMPTVYPPQSCGLEFTEKFEPFALSSI
jgi:hypothetical protein